MVTSHSDVHTGVSRTIFNRKIRSEAFERPLLNCVRAIMTLS